jgi:hypothetical protein
MSEFLRVQQGEGQVTQQEYGKNERDCGDHIDLHGLPQLLACLDVQECHDKKDNGKQQHHYILHCTSLSWLCVKGQTLRLPCTRLILGCSGFESQKDFLNIS